MSAQPEIKETIANFFSSRRNDYKTVGQEDGDLSFHTKTTGSQNVASPRRHKPWLVASGVAGLLLCSVALFEIGRRNPHQANCNELTTAWSPMRNLIRYTPVESTGDFFQPSPYRGAGLEVDAAWDKLWMIGGVPVRIEASDLVVLGKSPDRNWTTVPESMGGGYAGYPEVFHQLHCLNMVQMATFPDLYANYTLFADHSSHIVREHINYCIEIIRLQLQCSAEMTPILTENLLGRSLPAPDFKVIHVCKNFDELRAWTEAHLLHGVGGWDIPEGHGH